MWSRDNSLVFLTSLFWMFECWDSELSSFCVSPVCQMWLQLKIKWSSLPERNRASLRRWWRRRRWRRSRGAFKLPHSLHDVVCTLTQTLPALFYFILRPHEKNNQLVGEGAAKANPAASWELFLRHAASWYAVDETSSINMWTKGRKDPFHFYFNLWLSTSPTVPFFL